MTIPVPAAKSAAAKTPAVFIDGEAGATGMQIRERLAKANAVAVLGINPTRRKDPKVPNALMAQADVVVLCLPDPGQSLPRASAASGRDCWCWWRCISKRCHRTRRLPISTQCWRNTLPARRTCA